MSTRAVRRLEPEQLLRMPGGDRYELVDGIPVEKPMGAEADEIAVGIGALLLRHVRANGLGRVYGSQTGFQCFPSKPKQVRMPDAAFVADGRLPGNKTPKGYIGVSPDLAVEVVSPKDRYEDLQVKFADYKDARVRLVWVISPATKTVLVRRADWTLAELDHAGTLSGEDVVPGFTCPVADLFV